MITSRRPGQLISRQARSDGGFDPGRASVGCVWSQPEQEQATAMAALLNWNTPRRLISSRRKS